MCAKGVGKRGQVTIFIIVAIVIVSAVVGYFVLRDEFIYSGIPASIEPVYTTFLSCLEQTTSDGINVLESQGGYISLPDFEAGSRYMPFGSQLNFLGNPIPYWYYVSGNNIQKEQVPSVKDMETQLANYINLKARNCAFDSYYHQGFEIHMGEPTAKVSISKNSVSVNLDMDFYVNKSDEAVLVKTHKVDVKSNLGTLYEAAREVYDNEQKEMFLENYTVDTLRLYAPVDGVELTCSPMTWGADAVFDELQNAIEANTLSLKVADGDYSLKNSTDKYFVINSDVGANVRFLTSKNWENSFEVAPAEGNVLIARPVGNQEGLGILGFCYVAYHFVYNVRYPVLIQVYSGDEIFQFPVAVVIEGNKPRVPLDTKATEITEDTQFCDYKNTLVKVSTYDSRLNPVDSEISYECFGSVCDIGKTKNGVLNAEFPQCINGYIIAEADGFRESRYLQSVIGETNTEIILDRLYEKEINLKVGGNDYSKTAIISFVSGDSSDTIVYPEQKTINLSEEQYKIQVYIYGNSSLKLAATTKRQCIEIPDSGIGGLFGTTEEKCFDINVPEQIISNALVGGGSENYYILESELQNSKSLEINADKLPTPTSLEELQNNYVIFDSKGLDINFK